MSTISLPIGGAFRNMELSQMTLSFSIVCLLATYAFGQSYAVC
jgi:hypothetical protein